MSDTTMGKTMFVFRPDAAIADVEFLYTQREYTSGNPSPHVIEASQVEPLSPVIAFGFMARDPNATTTGFSTETPAFDGTVQPSNQFSEGGYKIYNSSPVDHTIDMTDEGWANYLGSGLIKLNTGISGVGAPTGCPNIGDVCSDGTVYAGLTSDGNVNMYTTPQDVFYEDDINGNNSQNVTNTTTGEANTETLYLNYAAPNPAPTTAPEYCYLLEAHGKDDWYLPSKDELNVLYTNKDAIGYFSTVAYWSSTEIPSANGRHCAQSFSTGSQDCSNYEGWRDEHFRCVRK
jgi:hypothetical protein